MSIIIKSSEDLVKMRQAGALAAQVLDYIEPFVVAGVCTKELDDLCAAFIKKNGSVSACIGYGNPPYPAHTCISVNHVICHGIPSDKKLRKGDIVNIDVTVIVDGFHGDTSRMFIVGEASILGKRLVDVAYQAMWAGIKLVKPGVRLGDIGHAIQTLAEGAHFSVVREFCGHGIGRGFHEDPQVLHFGRPNTGVELQAGMTFTIEPMINAGKHHLKILPDGWTVVTRDRSLSAQWEHTLAVTETGYEIFTLSQREKEQGISAIG